MTKIGSKEAQMRAMREGRASVSPEKKQQTARAVLAKVSAKKVAKAADVVIGKKHIMPTDNVVSLLATKASTVEGMPPIQKDAAYRQRKERLQSDPMQKPYIPSKYGILKRIVCQADAERRNPTKLDDLRKELTAWAHVRTYHAMALRFLNELIGRAKGTE